MTNRASPRHSAAPKEQDLISPGFQPRVRNHPSNPQAPKGRPERRLPRGLGSIPCFSSISCPELGAPGSLPVARWRPSGAW